MAPDTIFFEDDGYEISIHVNQIHGPRELEFIVHQIKPLISISFVEFCLQLYVYCDINWRWGRAIGPETVYYTRRPLNNIYLLMAGRKPIFSKTVCHMWPWNSQPWLFYITILYLYSNTLYLLPDIYYLLSIIYYLKSVYYLLSKICYLLSIIHYLSSIVYTYYLLSRLHCYQLLILSLGGCDATFVFLRLLKTWKLLLLIISWLFSYICYVKTSTIIGEMWAGSLSFNIVDFYLFTRIWISDMQITQRKT